MMEGKRQILSRLAALNDHIRKLHHNTGSVRPDPKARQLVQQVEAVQGRHRDETKATQEVIESLREEGNLLRNNLNNLEAEFQDYRDAAEQTIENIVERKMADYRTAVEQIMETIVEARVKEIERNYASGTSSISHGSLFPKGAKSTSTR